MCLWLSDQIYASLMKMWTHTRLLEHNTALAHGRFLDWELSTSDLALRRPSSKSQAYEYSCLLLPNLLQKRGKQCRNPAAAAHLISYGRATWWNVTVLTVALETTDEKYACEVQQLWKMTSKQLDPSARLPGFRPFRSRHARCILLLGICQPFFPIPSLVTSFHLR